MKILIIRLSSIGDIVLTTPIVRCLKQQLPGTEIHFLTKKQFVPVIQSNPSIDRIHLFKDNFQELIPKLKAEKFDHIVDLHKNFRSRYIRLKLRVPATSFPKLNYRKWLLTTLHINLLPDIHIVDRYFRAVSRFGVQNDHQGLDYPLLTGEQTDARTRFGLPEAPFVAIAIGARHYTKIFPAHRVAELCNRLQVPVILLGGKEDMARGESILRDANGKVINACGILTLNESASIAGQAAVVITNDTGMMHIAAALKRPVISIWGSTIPGFGMYPYLPGGEEHLSVIAEVKGLRCRPCSKLGYRNCPKGHFDCMEKISLEEVLQTIGNRLDSKEISSE